MYTATASVSSKDITWVSFLALWWALLLASARDCQETPVIFQIQKTMGFPLSSNPAINRDNLLLPPPTFHLPPSTTLRGVAVSMDSIAAEFGEGKSLYEILDVPSTATPASIKKAYFKLALKCVSCLSPRRRSYVHT